MNELFDGNAPDENSDLLPEEKITIEIHVDLHTGSTHPQQVLVLPVRVSAWIRFVAAFKNILSLPKPIGRLVFDILGRHDIADSSSVILGWLIIFVALFLLRGFIPLGPLIDWLMSRAGL